MLKPFNPQTGKPKKYNDYSDAEKADLGDRVRREKEADAARKKK